MRHLGSLVLSLIFGALVYVLLGYASFRVQTQDGWTTDNLVGLLALAGAGVAYAVLVVPRISPLGPALVGASYLGLGLWIVSDLGSFVRTMPTDVLGLDNAGFGAGTFLIPLGIPLVATLASPSRWMGRPRHAPLAPGTGVIGGPPPQQYDQYGQPGGYGSPNNTYNAPPAFGSPGSPVAQPGYDQYGYPNDPMAPDTTRRI